MKSSQLLPDLKSTCFTLVEASFSSSIPFNINQFATKKPFEPQNFDFLLKLAPHNTSKEPDQTIIAEMFLKR